MLLIAGHQPNYIPYIGFFAKVSKCDKFVIVDSIQYEKKEWQNRNKIRTKDGWMWLTVPVFTKGKFHQKINEVRINNSIDWRRVHWKSILFNYRTAPYFNEYMDFFEQLYSKTWEKFSDLTSTLIRYVADQLKIGVEIIQSSSFNPNGSKTDLLIDMCKNLNADAYLSGAGARSYVIGPKFKECNLRHFYLDFEHPVYKQRFEPFMEHMSIIDLLFNVEKEKVIELIINNGKVVESDYNENKE